MKYDFSLTRFWAMVIKEFIQMARDRVMFGMIVVIPLMQLLLFGYAINMDPKHLPTNIVMADNSALVRSFLQGMQNTGYFEFLAPVKTQEQADKALAVGDAQFTVSIPANFSRDLIRGHHPQLLIETDATDPVATGSAIAALRTLSLTVFNPDLSGALRPLQGTPPPFELNIHSIYNPLNITQYNIVPGLLGVILTMTLSIITALSITRERERGTMENLLATPIHPLEVLLGKLVPNIVVGYVQFIIILAAAWLLFTIPIEGSLLLLAILSLPFIVANLAVGLTFSTLAENQMQAAQSTMFFFLPSILLSGFMFPFRGMPQWAQYIGDLLPLTHYIKIVKGILLKGNGFIEVWPATWPILIFTVLIIAVAVMRYRQTLD